MEAGLILYYHHNEELRKTGPTSLGPEESELLQGPLRVLRWPWEQREGGTGLLPPHPLT